MTLTDSKGNRDQADAVFGCDGVKSVIRERMVGDPARVTKHVVYRAVVEVENMSEDLRVNAPMLWADPRCHLVHYPLRGGQQYNLVVTFHSRNEEQWGVTDGSKEEVLSYFEGIHERPGRCSICPPRGAAGPLPTSTRWSSGAKAVRPCSATLPTRCKRLAKSPFQPALAMGAWQRRLALDASLP